MYKYILILAIFYSAQGNEFDGCELGWFRYENTKCVYIFNFDSTFEESETYCTKNFGAKILNISDNEERKFWSFHLVRFSNISNNVWLQRPDSLNNSNCLALRSKYSNDNFKIGSIIQQDCESSGTTVCEILANKKLKTKELAKEYNPNESMVPNRQIKYANGTLSDLFTGVYYVITSKYKNSSFSNSILGNGKCSLVDETSGCSTMFHDKDFDDKYGNFYMFTSDNDQQVQIRRFNSEKIIVYEPDKFLSNYYCGQDSLSVSGRRICARLLEDYKANDKWELTSYNNSEYFLIKSTTNNYTFGAKIFEDGKNGTLGFGLFDPVNEKQIVDDKFLFKIEPLNYTLFVELYSISFDKSLEDIVASNKKQISIVDTAIITNNSPATLTHEVESTKELTESFSTSYGYSEQFMESISNMAEISKSLSDAKSQTRSFKDSTSHAIASTLSRSVSNSQSSTSERSGSVNGEVGVNADVGIEATEDDKTKAEAKFSFNAKIGGASGGSHSNSNTRSEENTNSKTTNDENSHENTNGHDKSHSNSTDNRKSNENTQQKSNSTEKRIEQAGSTTRKYSIFKTVSLPPYSAVKISSYANWINDLQIPFNMTLKFSVQSFRRQMDGTAFNSWKTLDSEFVKHVMKAQLFNGFIKKEFFDAVVGELSGYLRASVGLESVFIAKEVKLENNLK